MLAAHQVRTGLKLLWGTANLFGHSFEHEIATAVALGIMGSIDINRGDPQNGWDTDQFPNNVTEITQVIHKLLRGGGFNFDAKVSRQSRDPEDMFHAPQPRSGRQEYLENLVTNAS